MIDIVNAVQSYGIKLRKVGKVYQGLCPFHDDTRPSFTVYPETNTFYCFGCGTFGDVAKFIKMIDPARYDQFKVDLSSLQHTVNTISSRNYKSYLLAISAKIFHNMLQKYPIDYVFKIMKKFDNFIENNEIITLTKAIEVIEKLKSLGGNQ
jgi:DNA primase